MDNKISVIALDFYLFPICNMKKCKRKISNEFFINVNSNCTFSRSLVFFDFNQQMK